MLPGMRQKALTSAADAASGRRQLDGASALRRLLKFRSPKRCQGFPGSHSSTAAKRMETAAFVTELRQRLHKPDSSCDAWCPKCNESWTPTPCMPDSGLKRRVTPAGAPLTYSCRPWQALQQHSTSLSRPAPAKASHLCPYGPREEMLQ